MIQFCKELFDETGDTKYKNAIDKAKRAYRKALKNYCEPKNYDAMIQRKDGESCKILFCIEFEGTKQELINYLWETQAISTGCNFDCSGRPFTTYFQVAHIKDNIYKVCEHRSIDV